MIPSTQRNTDVMVFAIPLMWIAIFAALGWWGRGLGLAKAIWINCAVVVVLWFGALALVALA